MVEQRQRFVVLIAAGVTITEAARQLGIAGKTATRWRHGWPTRSASGVTRHQPSVYQCPVAEISPRFLSEVERLRIGDLRQQGLSIRAIAGELGRRWGYSSAGIASLPAQPSDFGPHRTDKPVVPTAPLDEFLRRVLATVELRAEELHADLLLLRRMLGIRHSYYLPADPAGVHIPTRGGRAVDRYRAGELSEPRPGGLAR
jgi:hypothetical protein